MEKPALSRNVDQLLGAIQLCRRSLFFVPALLIAYSGIDALAALVPPESRASPRRRFEAWVSRFLLPDPRVPCTATDLYAARCAVVHRFGPESDLAAKGEARRLVYALGDSTAEQIQRAIDAIGMPNADIAVHVDAILDAFERSVWRFRKAILTDPALQQQVESSHQFFSGVSHGTGFSILDIRIG